MLEWYLAHYIFISETGQVSNLQYKKTIKAETDADAFLGGQALIWTSVQSGRSEFQVFDYIPMMWCYDKKQNGVSETFR